MNPPRTFPPRTPPTAAGGQRAAPTLKLELEELASLAGVEPVHLDGFGRERRIEVEPLMELLRALGVGIDSAEDAGDAFERMERERLARRIEPVHVVEDGEVARVRVRVEEKRREEPIEASLRLEDGSTEAVRLDPARARTIAAFPLDGARIVELDLALELAGARELPPGCHELSLDLPGPPETARSLVIRAPRRAYALGRRIWGTFLPLYAVRTARDRGCGDFADLRRWIDLASELGASTVGTLPLLAAYLEGPLEPSPYNAASRLAWNEMYVAPELAPEFEASGARRLAESPELRERIAAARKGELVDHGAVISVVRPLLEAMRRSLAKLPERESAFRAWLAEHPRVADYARFRAAVQRHGTWTRWHLSARDGTLGSDDYDPAAAEHHAYAQWLANEQLEALDAHARARGSGLYLDLPVGVHRESYDTWRERGSFLLGVSAGAPPDAIFERGQDWGFPPLHPWRCRELGHRYSREVLRHHLRFANLLRVDHVMGWHRMYCIPKGCDATQGAYVRFPAREMYALACLESVRCRAAIVGEDLGTVPEEVRPEMERRGILRMHVLELETRIDPHDALPAPPRGSLAALNTHDLPPFAAFWRALDTEDRLARGLLDEEAAAREREGRKRVREAVVRFLRARKRLGAEPDDERAILAALLEHLAASEAEVVVVDLADLALETEPHNRPGSVGETNWRLRARGSMAELDPFFRRDDVRDALLRVASQRPEPS